MGKMGSVEAASDLDLLEYCVFLGLTCGALFSSLLALALLKVGSIAWIWGYVCGIIDERHVAYAELNGI